MTRRCGGLFILLATLTVAAYPDLAAAQTPPAVPGFNSARTPTSPAFTLMGLEPSSVERPANPSDFSLGLLTKTDNVATVPKDFAVETSPYWLFRHPNLTWDDDVDRNVWQSLARTSSFGVGTGEVGTSAAPVRALAFGGRASVLSGRLSDETQAQLKRLEELLTAEATLGLQMMAEQLNVLNQMLVSKQITAEEHTKLASALQIATIQSKQYKDSAERKATETLMEKFATVREGFILEVAGAAGWRFPRADWSQGDFDRWGLWATPSYVGKSTSVVGVFRYLSKDATAGTTEGVFDVGVRGVQFRDKYALSVEYMRRSFRASNLEDGHRLVGIAEYAVTDTAWLVVSFGRDHNTKRDGSLIAQLGLSFNFKDDRVVKPTGAAKR
jgi:hypothetical protein